MYPKRVPSLLQLPLGSMVWRMPKARREVYLTFDDGPTPEVTNEVLGILDQFGAKATFFGIGKNVEAHPDIWQNVISGGHSIGHHTYSHMNGWKVNLKDYVADSEKAAELVDSPLFRPPYGRISPRKAKALGKKYNIIMWSVLSGDFDRSIDSEQVSKNVLKNLKPGDIVVFHDSVKAWPRLEKALPKVLEHIRSKGWEARGL